MKLAGDWETRAVSWSNLSPGGLYSMTTYPDGSARFNFASARFLEMVDLTEAEVMADPQHVFDCVHPDDRLRLAQASRAAMRKGEEWHEEFSIRHKQGRVVNIDGYCRPVPQSDGSVMWYGVLIDITEILRAQEASLQNQALERYHKRIAELTPSGLYTLTTRPGSPPKLEYTSPRFMSILGLTESSLTDPAFTILNLIAPEDVPHVVEAVMRAQENHLDWSLEFTIIRPDGQRIEVEAREQPNVNPDGTITWYGILNDITARKAQERIAQERLELSKQLNTLLELVPGGFYVVRTNEVDGRTDMLYASPKYLQMMGVTEAEFKSPDFQIEQLTHPDDIPKVRRANMEALRNMKQFREEIRMVLRNGTEIIVEAHSHPHREPDGTVMWYGMVIDITAVKQVEIARAKLDERLKETENNYRILAENIESPVAIVDEQGDLLYLNAAGVEVLQVPPSEVHRDSWRKMVSSKTWQERLRIVREVLKTNEKIVDEHHLVVKGQTRWYRRTFQPVKSDGELRQVLITSIDITNSRLELEQHKQYAEELELKVAERTQELRQALLKEHELAELKSKFVATTSHEFRTPLATINMTAGFVRRFKDRINADALEQKMQVIERQVSHMSKLLDDILTLGRGDAGMIEVHLNPISPLALAHEIAEQLEDNWNNHAILIHKQGVPDLIKSDEKLLRAIFTNLLTNALKFSFEKAPVNLSMVAENNQLIITVQDKGIGIPMADQPVLFQPFHRGSNTTTIQGNGLGLSIVRKAVELLGGTVTFVSTPNVGTTFTVCLPII